MKSFNVDMLRENHLSRIGFFSIRILLKYEFDLTSRSAIIAHATTTLPPGMVDGCISQKWATSFHPCASSLPTNLECAYVRWDISWKLTDTWYHAFMSFRRCFSKIFSWLARIFCVVVLMFLSGGSTFAMRGPSDQVRRYTRQNEFEFLGWTLASLSIKLGQFSLGVTEYLPEEERTALVVDYFDKLNQLQQRERELENLLGDPAITEQSKEVQFLREQTLEFRAGLDHIQPVAESILQEQVAFILGELGLGAGGKIIPPVAFKFTQLPLALIVSPRDVIRMDANIQLIPSLTIDQKIELEDQISQDLDVSSLIVNIGGIGLYPTMVLESASLRWIVETIVHEWVHNYLTLRPLGLNYATSPDHRTMNETVASLLGNEIGFYVLEHYYPDFAPERVKLPPTSSTPSTEPPTFNFRAEMHETRVMVDQMLADGLIEEAEAYMEERRQFIWENGYHLRKLNQAYFAFHGAYADVPQGAAGEDPVGDAVREYWNRLDSPVDFLISMSWMNEFSDLERELQELSTTP